MIDADGLVAAGKQASVSKRRLFRWLAVFEATLIAERVELDVTNGNTFALADAGVLRIEVAANERLRQVLFQNGVASQRRDVQVIAASDGLRRLLNNEP